VRHVASFLQSIPPIRLLTHCSRISAAGGDELLIEVVAYGVKGTAKARSSVSCGLSYIATKPQNTTRTPVPPEDCGPLAVQDHRYKICAQNFSQDYMRVPASGVRLPSKCLFLTKTWHVRFNAALSFCNVHCHLCWIAVMLGATESCLIQHDKAGVALSMDYTTLHESGLHLKKLHSFHSLPTPNLAGTTVDFSEVCCKFIHARLQGGEEYATF
jgi:hypothetical protein